MKKILACVVIVLNVTGIIYAQEATAEEPQLHGQVGVTYTTKYLWRGFDVFDDHATIHPSLDLDLWDTGFGLHASSGYELTERWDYTLSYKGIAFEGERYMTSYVLGYRWFNYPDMSSHTSDSFDLHEVHGVFAFAKIRMLRRLLYRLRSWA